MGNTGTGFSSRYGSTAGVGKQVQHLDRTALSLIHISGWRLGYVIAQPEIADRVKKVHDFLTVGAAAPLMEAAVVGLNFGDDYYQQLQAHYTHMKELFVGGLKDIGLTFTCLLYTSSFLYRKVDSGR